MTEFELATGFLQGFAESAAAAADAGHLLDDREAFFRHCEELDVEPTAERLELVRDLGAVLAEHFVDEDLDATEIDGACVVASEMLVDGLEQHGWRLAFLARPVG